jgi:hypothetical protein
MKPCRPFKKRIALSILEGQNDAAIQDHLAQCAACRAYAEEIRVICAEHAERATHLPEEDAPLRLHGKIRAALDAPRGRRNWFRPVAAGAVAVLTIGLYLHWRPSPKPMPGVATPSSPRQLSEPSYAAYRNHLSRSTEELEAALSRQDTGAGAGDQLLAVSSRASVLQSSTSP